VGETREIVDSASQEKLDKGASMADRVGQRLGNYTLLRLLGQGGFAEVYLGEHFYLKSQAAIKVLQTRLSSQEDMDSFLKEAQTIARLSHPNIIRVLDFGLDQETPFLAMDYAPNGTLRQRHPRGVPVPLATIVPYVKQIADALQYAHDEHFIHRDVKPENMLIGRRNEILLSDFGIALAAQSSRYEGTQDVIGTVAYMSPEQIQGKPRPASDQYSLAVVVYEWLTGDRPFHGTFTEMCTQHMFAEPALLETKLNNIPPDLAQVVMKALAKDPKNRFPRIQLFAQALEEVAASGHTNLLAFTEMPTIAARVDNTNNAATSADSTRMGNLPSTGFSQNNSGTSFATTPATSAPAQQFGPFNNQTNNQYAGQQSAGYGQPSGPSAQQQAGSANQFTPPQKLFLPGGTGNASGFNNTQMANSAGSNIAPTRPPFPAPAPGISGNQGGSGQRYPQQAGYGTPPPASGYPQSQYQGYPQPAYRTNNENPGYDNAARYPYASNSSPNNAPGAAGAQSGTRQTGTNADQDIVLKQLNRWKWHILATIVGIILFPVCSDLHVSGFTFTISLLLVIPIFFGASFGIIVGVIVGVVGALIEMNLSNSLISARLLALLPLGGILLFGGTGLLAGLSKFRRHVVPTLGSSFRACFLAAIGLLVFFGWPLYRAFRIDPLLFQRVSGIHTAEHLGLTLVINVFVSFVLLVIYSALGALIDPS
jgi:serine/threonine protein kinase